MPAEKKFRHAFQNYYKALAEDIALYHWVIAIRSVLTKITIQDAVKLYLKYYDFSEDEFPLNTAIQMYYRVKDQFDEKQKDENKAQN